MRHVFPTAESPITITFSSASYERLSVVDITVLQLEGLGGRYLESGYNSLAGVRYLECGHPTSGFMLPLFFRDVAFSSFASFQARS